MAALVERTVTREAFQSKYADVFKGDDKWQAVETVDSETYNWPPTSTYIQNPPYFQNMAKEPGVISDISGARVLALLGDMVTTDHISPAGSFKATTPAGKYLTDRQIATRDFNSYGSRRGNHEIMMRGTFANIRIRNEMLDGVEGGYTLGPDGEQTSIFDASMAYQAAGVPLVIFGGGELLKNKNGLIIGAVGVSGDSVENDVEVAKAGAESIDIWCKVHADQREQATALGEEAFAALLKKPSFPVPPAAPPSRRMISVSVPSVEPDAPGTETRQRMYPPVPVPVPREPSHV